VTGAASRTSRRAASRILAALAAGMAFSLAATSAQAVNIERVRSPAGIEAWLVRDPNVPLIAMEFAFAGGSEQDPKDKPGVANLAVSLLDEGAGPLDAKAFQGELEHKAIEMSFRVGRDYARGTMRTLKEHRDAAFDYLRLALTAPRFDPQAVERIRAQALAQLRRNAASPNHLAGTTWWATAFPDHPYGQPTAGTLASVPAITVDDLRAYVGRVFGRDTLKIGIVGDIDAETAGRLIDRAFAGLPAKATLSGVNAVTPRGVGQRRVIDLDVPQTVLMFGAAGIARSDPDFMAAYIVNHIVGGGSFSSRLYSEVREKRGLVYGISESLAWLRHSAVLLGSTATRADAARETLDVIEAELLKMAEEGPTAEEFAKTKTYLKGSYPLGLDTSGKIAAQLVQIQLDNLGIDYMQRRSALIDAVSLADTKRVAKRLYGAGLLVTVVGRPQGVKSN
jgi:zinc protease